MLTSRTAQQLCDLERVKPQPPPSLLLGLEPVQSCLGVARVMSERKVPRSVEQRIVIKFLVGENVPSAEIHHRLQQQYREECLLRRHSSPYCCRTAAAQCGLFTYKSVPVIFEPPCIIILKSKGTAVVYAVRR